MNIIRRLGPLSPYIGFFLATIVFLTLSRLLLAWINWDRVTELSVLLHVLALGLRMDTVVLAMVLVFPVGVALLLPVFVVESLVYRSIVSLFLSAWGLLFALMEFVTPVYVDFFDTRPGRIFFEYLSYPKEVGLMLANGFLIESILVFTGTLVSVAVVFLGMGRLQRAQGQWSYVTRLISLPIVLALLVLAGRSTLGHRPINASSVAFSNDQLLNELALSSTYTLLTAIYALKYEGDPASLYPKMPKAEVLQRARAATFVEESRFNHPDFPTLHRLGAESKEKPNNLVILLEESMGARFVGKLGGLPLSPELDKLADEGIWLTNLYATGIRSARGIEAVVTGFPPSASRSVLKLGLAQHGFYTVAQTLKRKGYRSYFVYGGESHFDNMRGFLLNNGFDVVVDEKDYAQWNYKGSWGVSDEDVFNKAHEIFLTEQKPFFAVVFSSSFHSPFEFPDDRIELYDEEKSTKYNAVKYADYAIGHFFAKAKRSNYWADTIFLVVADHDERPRGSSLVPVSSYHIPGLILGAGIEPMVYSKVASQIDLMPTLLGLSGVRADVPFVGQDIFQRPDGYPGRALMQFGSNHAYMLGDQVVIHAPGRQAMQFLYKDKRLEPTILNSQLAREALAMALLPGLLYQNQLYRLPPD